MTIDELKVIFILKGYRVPKPMTRGGQAFVAVLPGKIRLEIVFVTSNFITITVFGGRWHCTIRCKPEDTFIELSRNYTRHEFA